MIDPEPRRRLDLGRYARTLLTATLEDRKGVTPEELLLFMLLGGAALFIGEGDLGMARWTGQLFGLVAGLVLTCVAKYSVRLVRRRVPGFLHRGSAGVPISPVRWVFRVVARLLLTLLAVVVVVAVVAFLLLVPPTLAFALTGHLWMALVFGVPLSALSVWGYSKLMSYPHPRRRSGPARPAAAEDDREGDPSLYEVHLGWHRALALPLGGSLGFVVLGCWIWWSGAPLLALVSLVVFGGTALFLVANALRGTLALRVDGAGVALSRQPIGPFRQEPPRPVPWPDIEAVVLFERITGPRRITWVGLRPRPGLPPLPGAGNQNVPPVPGVPGEVQAHSMAADVWDLDEDRLARAIELNAPQVHLVDLRE